MNKYLKMLMLSGGLVAAIAPTAIDIDKKPNTDLGYIYENIEKMQETLPKLSRVNYNLNIDLSDNNEHRENYTILDNEIIDTNNMTTEEYNSNIINENNTSNINNTTSENNITFTTTNENGEEITLSDVETINYLNETLVQTNIEYEELKNILSNAIKETMDYLEAYKNGEHELTNEQKLYIKEHTNSIKFLAETLENLSEDVICCIDGCENCDNKEDFESTASNYLTTINSLETRINALNNAIASLQFVYNIGNPHFWTGRIGPNHMFYGYHDFNSLQPDIDNTQNDNMNSDNNISQYIENDNISDNEYGVLEVEENSTNNNIEDSNTSVDNDETNQDDVDNLSTDTSTSTEDEDKPTTFGLKSNIDTYAPTRRNIDTFFNTALYNNEYMNGHGYSYGYGAPYGGYGYGMPYGQGYYGQPYGGMGLNSNLVNRQVLENQQNEVHNSHNNMANVEQESPEDVQKPKRLRTKRAKNIDTYTATTIQSNVNTMGESKISKFFKEKFNNLRNKVRKQKKNVSDNTLPQDNLQDETITPNANEENQTTLDDKLNINDTNSNQENIVNNQNSENSLTIDNSSNSPTIKQEDDINAK